MAVTLKKSNLSSFKVSLKQEIYAPHHKEFSYVLQNTIGLYTSTYQLETTVQYRSAPTVLQRKNFSVGREFRRHYYGKI